MNILLRVLFILCFLSNIRALAQDYCAPLDIKMYLSGTFGELRSNHFHAGVDIKTDGKEGLNVYAIEEGYVSRVKVSSWGYGKVIYINHPDGRTSVYAHLKDFNKKIDSIVSIEHYKKESFELDLYLKKNKILIRKNEVIGLSGNSGSSSGPHLHFEIRETDSQNPLNPLNCFDIIDNISPTIKKIKLYSINKTKINGSNEDKIFNVKKKNNTYTIEENITLNGEFALGVYTYDKCNGSHNKNGIYSITVNVDSIKIYEFKVDKLDFRTSRYINAHIDYKEKKQKKEKYHRCFKLANNKLTNYKTLINKGIININDTNIHTIKVTVSDFYKNSSELIFNVKLTNQYTRNSNRDALQKETRKFLHKRANVFKTNDFEIHMERNSLYEDIEFYYSKQDSINEIIGKLHKVHDINIPVHKKYIISIKTNIKKELKDKAYIARKNKNNRFLYMGGSWRNSFLRAKVREFGDFCVVVDTIKPKIKGINIFPGKKIKNQKTIKLTIEDNESGIKSYRAELNKKWILMQYDHKKKLLHFDINKALVKDTNILELKVEDNVGNFTEYRAEFTTQNKN